LEAHASHEQGGEHGHAARALAAHLVIDPEPAVALQAAKGLLRLPAPLLEPEAVAVPDPDDLDRDAVAVEERLGLVPGEAAIEPDQEQRGMGGQITGQGAQRPVLVHVGRDDAQAKRITLAVDQQHALAAFDLLAAS